MYVKFFALIIAADAIAVVPFAKLRSGGRPIRYGLVKLINILFFIVVYFILLDWFPEWIKYPEFFSDICASWFREGWLGNVFIANLVASVVTLLLLIPQIMGFRFRLDNKLIKSM